MHSFLRYGVIASFCISLVSLIILALRTYSFGKKPYHAETGETERKGIFYALGKGLMPWEKESAREHFVTYIAGVLYHSGIFAALFYILCLIAPFRLSVTFLHFLRTLMAIGILCGLGFLLKRIVRDYMRKISCVDDYVSNIFVNLFALVALIDTFTQDLRIVLLSVSILLFLYIPVGKIRHCFFFFYSRILFGRFFGRRGVLPQKKSIRVN